MSVIQDGNIYIFNCPHCQDIITVNKKQLNCCIFRHGVFKNNMKQINPHSSKETCDRLKKENKIIGCGKPFMFIKSDNPRIEICDYI